MASPRMMNPGSIHVRWGVLNAEYEAAAGAGDLARASNWLRLMRTAVGIFMDESAKREYSRLAGYATGDARKTPQVFDDMEEKREYLHKIAQGQGIGTMAPEEWGDSSTLEEPIPDAGG